MEWKDVVEIGTALPEVEESTWYRTPSMKVRTKSFCRMKEDGENLVVRVVDLDDKEALLQQHPGVLHTTPHYDGHPFVLVNLPKARKALVRELIEDAWRCQAPKTVLAEYDEG